MRIYDLVRWVVCVPIVLLGCWIILMNFVIVYRWYARREHHSFVPLSGGFLALIGFTICPQPAVQRFGFIPLAVDIGYCVLVLTLGLVGAVVKRFIKTEKAD